MEYFLNVIARPKAVPARRSALRHAGVAIFEIPACRQAGISKIAEPEIAEPVLSPDISGRRILLLAMTYY